MENAWQIQGRAGALIGRGKCSYRLVLCSEFIFKSVVIKVNSKLN